MAFLLPSRSLEDIPRFWTIKSRQATADIGENISALLREAFACCGVSENANPKGAAKVLRTTLERVCMRAKEVTCVLELWHTDAVYSDLYANVYVQDYFETPRRCVRVSIFACSLDMETFASRPGMTEGWERPPRQDGESLQKDFVGSVVITPCAGGLAGRTLLDPKWIVQGPALMRLTDMKQTIRGRRLVVPSLPWRQQDGEAMSCAETSLLTLSCYYSNEYSDYPVMMPSKMLGIIQRGSDVRVVPSQGRDSGSIARVLQEMGLRVRKYGFESLAGTAVPGEPFSDAEGLRRLTRVYVDSGIPVAVNVQPKGPLLGHWVVATGLQATDGSYADWISSSPYAERIELEGRSLEYIDAYNLEQSRPFVVSDDTEYPYRFAGWSELSGISGMEPVELVVPTAQKMALGAMTARELAGEILRSPVYGPLKCSDGMPEEELVLTQQLVSVRSYLRMRCASCDTSVARVYEEGMFPRFAWLFELVSRSVWNEAVGTRVSVAELLLDATAQSQVGAYDRIVLVRYPGYLLYRDPWGKERKLPSKDVSGTFVSYDRNLRIVERVPDVVA